MRTVGKRKITYGHVVQTFNDEGKCIEQEFVVGDQVEWEGDDLEPIDADTDCEYQPFHMVQPQAMAVVLIGNLLDGYGAVGPFTDSDEAERWAEGPGSWIMILQSPYEKFDSAKVETPIARYIRTNAGRCPHCASDDLSCGEVQTDDARMYRGVVCGSCKKEWTDEYALTGVTTDE